MVSCTFSFVKIVKELLNIARYGDLCYTYRVVIRRRIEVVITGLTRNQFDLRVTWVRIPPSPPLFLHCTLPVLGFSMKSPPAF